MGTDRLLNAQELAVLIKSSVPTISMWYKWKELHPNHELAKLLPDFERHGSHKARYWHYSDIPKILEFRSAIPQGRKGIMGEITQKYVNKDKKQRR